MAVSLELLTDDSILDYTKTDGEDHVLYDRRDVNLQRSVQVYCYPGGVYDPLIFGSPIANRCICGRLQRPTPYPCPNCGTRAFSSEDGLRRFARIELPFFYLNDLRFGIFMEFFEDVFKDAQVELNFTGNLKAGGYSSDKAGRKLGIKVFDSCQFEYNADKKLLTISEDITDVDKCSYEGIYAILNEHFPEKAGKYRELINRYYLVLPAMMRPFRVSRVSGSAKMNVPQLSQWYSLIIRLCDDKNDEGNGFKAAMEACKSPGMKVRYMAVLRAFLNAGKKVATDLLNTSKKNLARQIYGVRTENSARCPIVPSTTLPIDELGVPRHIAYEMCREGFMKHLIQELNFTPEQAKIATRDEAKDPELQKLFTEYAEKQVVLEFTFDEVNLMVR